MDGIRHLPSPPRTSRLRDRFEENLERVHELVLLYEVVAGKIKGRPSVKESDILRAAVILLHASVEDLFRGIGMLRLPDAGREVLDKLPSPGGDGRGTKMTLGDLSGFRGQLVDDLILESVRSHLDRRSYNDATDLASALVQSSLRADLVTPHADQLDALMKRRHQIAHRLDRHDLLGKGRHSARSLGKETVGRWLDIVRTFGISVLNSMPSDEPEVNPS